MGERKRVNILGLYGHSAMHGFTRVAVLELRTTYKAGVCVGLPAYMLHDPRHRGR